MFDKGIGLGTARQNPAQGELRRRKGALLPKGGSYMNTLTLQRCLGRSLGCAKFVSDYDRRSEGSGGCSEQG